MLNKKNRLKKRKEFGYLYKHADSRYSKYLKLYFISSKQKNIRIGISVSNKIGNAITRNKTKRRLRAILRELLPAIKQKTNYIVLAKEGIDTLDFTQLKNEVIALFNRANMFENVENLSQSNTTLGVNQTNNIQD